MFRIPPHMIGAPTGDSMTYSTVEQESIDFVRYSYAVVAPYRVGDQRRLGSRVPAQYLRFELGALLRSTRGPAPGLRARARSGHGLDEPRRGPPVRGLIARTTAADHDGIGRNDGHRGGKQQWQRHHIAVTRVGPPRSRPRGSPPSEELHGFAALYDTEAQLDGFVETIQRGAFAKALASDPDVYLTFNHSATGSWRAPRAAR